MNALHQFIGNSRVTAIEYGLIAAVIAVGLMGATGLGASFSGLFGHARPKVGPPS